MKRIVLLFLVATTALQAIAQTNAIAPQPEAKHRRKYTADSALSRWALDINGLFGVMTQDLTTSTSTAGYLNGVNLNTGTLKFNDGMSVGFDAQIGYFFGPKCHWGIGTGFMYLGQYGNMTLDNYHVEYQATDIKNRIFRQMITGSNLKEDVRITNMNIPLLLKYKYRFSKHLGFTADAGALFNMQMKNASVTRGVFDYEGIYRFTAGNLNGEPTTYDGNPVPLAGSEIITKSYYLAHPTNDDVNTRFQQQAAADFGVGLNKTPNNDKDEVSYKSGSIGFMVQPSLSWYLSDHVALNLGFYYIYQSFKNDNLNYYALMNTKADYSSSLNNVSSSVVQSYGANVGVRFLFGKLKDTDGDGIPDKHDNCPEVWGLPQFNGCPDTDKDGIQDSEDSCRTIPGLAKFNGCPDSDNDGIPDKADECPFQAGSASLKGCPDRDGDGIADKNDLCPDKPGLAQYKGCPDTDSDGIPDNEDQCPEVAGPASNNGCPLPPPPSTEPALSTPILFEVNKTVVQESSRPVLAVAIKTLNADDKAIVIVHGHADSRGKVTYNKKLSLRRALAVKKELVKMGADAKRIKVIGHGENDPTATNDTEEGRSENRRAVMRLNVE